jgi:predicted PurR-regulated permease PerM
MAACARTACTSSNRAPRRPTVPSRHGPCVEHPVTSYSSDRTLRFLTLALVLAAGVTLAPYWAPVVLAAWIADLLRPVARLLQRLLRGRRRAAAAVVVLLVAAVLLPLAGATAAAVTEVRQLTSQLRGAFEGQQTFGGVLLGGGVETQHSLREWADLASRYGENAWRAATLVARASLSVLLIIIVFVAALYTLAANPRGSYRWLAHHSPIPRDAFIRFARAFRETGRGLLIGAGGTALVQGVVATVAYAAMGLPRAFLLGPLTALSALVPAIGTGLVWIPLTVELGLAGDYVRAAILFIVGAALGLIDNFVRPVLTRYARLQLPMAVVLVSMLGGLAAFGPSGVLLGPLVVRLAVEALAIARDKRVFASG